MEAKIIGSSQFDFPQGGEEPPRAQFPVARVVAARTRNLTLIGGWFGELQQLGERRRSGLLHGSAESHLDRFQIGAPTTLAFGEDASEQRSQFPRDLALDRLGCFFSSGVSVSSTGRNAQSFSLTSMIFPQSS